MLRSLPAIVLALVLLAPAAAAFANSHDRVALSYDATKAPVLLATGDLHATGTLHGGFLVGSLDGSTVSHIPQLSLTATRNGTIFLSNVTDATLVLHSGALLWKLDNATSASLDATAAYGFGLALPQSPFDEGSDNATRSPAFAIVGPHVSATISWKSGDALLIPIDATLTVLDASGKAVPDWDHATFNEHADVQSASHPDPNAPVALLRASGAFDAALSGQLLAGGLGASGQDLRVAIAASSDDRFLETATALTNATRAFSGGGSDGGDGGDGGGIDASMLDTVSAISPVLNGAVLILNGGGGENGAEPSPVEATLGDRPLDAKPFALMRSQDLALAWGDGKVSVEGTSAMTLTKDGVSTTAPLVVGLVPILSVLLWLGAIAAIVFFFVKRPPTSKGNWKLRLASYGVYAVVFLLVAWYWDHSFKQTFGTSVLTILFAHGSHVQFQQLALVFGLESIPWTLAALLFALPVRIILGVLLRYRGEGSSFKRVAGAGGLVSLAIFGPLYALWIVNVLLAQALKMFGPK